MITSDDQMVYLSRYIHRNPASNDLDVLTSGLDLEVLRRYRYSSLRNYLGEIKQSWVKCDEILEIFSKTEEGFSYESFVSNGLTSGSNPEVGGVDRG